MGPIMKCPHRTAYTQGAYVRLGVPSSGSALMYCLNEGQAEIRFTVSQHLLLSQNPEGSEIFQLLLQKDWKQPPQTPVFKSTGLQHS